MYCRKLRFLLNFGENRPEGGAVMANLVAIFLFYHLKVHEVMDRIEQNFIDMFLTMNVQSQLKMGILSREGIAVIAISLSHREVYEVMD